MNWFVLYEIVGLVDDFLTSSRRGGDAIAVFLGVEIAEINVVGGWRHLAAAAVGEDKHARAGAVLGHGGSPESEF
jgi:hypothetical protein